VVIPHQVGTPNFTNIITLTTSALTPGTGEKGGSAMAKLHARPSNQYRYEHYDPWGGGLGAL